MRTARNSSNSLDQLTSVGSILYDYDGRGNLEQITNGSQITNYTYDAADRLAMVDGPSSVVEFAYDADGRRVQQTAGTQVTNYLWDETSAYGDVVLETDGSGNTLASYVLDGRGIVSQSRNGATSYYLQDGQGSTRALTNAAGTVTDTYSYTAFGELFNQTGSTANSYLYTGQQFDSLTGLYDLRARYYNPAAGRFWSQDTYPVNFGNPVELNRYGYTANNPVNRADPSGQLLVEDKLLKLSTAAQTGALIGAGMGVAQTILCGGDMQLNVGLGMLGGMAFAVAWAAAPAAAAAASAALGYFGAKAAIDDMRANKITGCNIFSLVVSLAAIAGSVAGISGGGTAMRPVAVENNGGGYTLPQVTQGGSILPLVLTALGTGGFLSRMPHGNNEKPEQYGSRKAPPEVQKYLDRLPKTGMSINVRPGEINYEMLAKLHYYGEGDEFSLYELSNGNESLVRGYVRGGKIPQGAIRDIAHSHPWAMDTPSNGDYEVLWYFKNKYGQSSSYIVTEYGKVIEYWNLTETTGDSRVIKQVGE